MYEYDTYGMELTYSDQQKYGVSEFGEMEREICGSGNELNGRGIYFTFHVHSLVFSLPNQMNHDILGIYKYICWKESQSSHFK